MVKTVGLMPRRTDTTRAAFREHYETRHAPLALGKFPFEKYIRNHIVASDPDPIGFDCLSEFWVGDVSEIHKIMAGPIGDIMREDERRFTDQPNIGPAVAEATHIFGPPRIIDDGMIHKEILLIRPAAGVGQDAFIEAVKAWGADMGGAGLSRIVLDTVVPFEGRPFPPFNGILYGWGSGLYDAKAPAGIEIYGRLKTESVETRFS
ncbi:MAG TPA: EthD domain-containing protein [Alphaproteobacteria bacterium]|nr:EthD domain-containing protein [Alphaproteobacteria bacterium]